MLRHPPGMLTTSFYAFYDLHRPAYLAYAGALLPAYEAPVAVEHTLTLVAHHWLTVVTMPSPSAWAWNVHTATIAHRTHVRRTQTEDTVLLHEDLGLSIDRIATVTGTSTATAVTQLQHARRSTSARTPRRATTGPPCRQQRPA